MAFSRAGHLLFATRRGVWDWNPGGAERATLFELTPEALFGAGASITKAEAPEYITVVPSKGKVHQNWRPRATFSADGTTVAFVAENETFAETTHYMVRKFVARILRTDTGAPIGTFSKVLKVESTPQYAFLPHLSPTGRFLAIQKPYQVELFEVASGRSTLRRVDGFDETSSFLTDTTLLRSRGTAIEVVDMETGRVVRTLSSAPNPVVSPDRTSVAVLRKGTVHFWNVTTGASAVGCKHAQPCEACAVEWTDATHVRVFDFDKKETQLACATDASQPVSGPYEDRPVFQGEGFSVTAHVGVGSEPSRVIISAPKADKEAQIPGAHMSYLASHERLLVQSDDDDSLFLVDSTGQVTKLSGRR
ncbi:MAG: hypothetical protein HOO96_21160 [Polyangiaceae bacterium]|nr:hypothetical protein [Polyangiaceae bacterium]